MKKRMFSLILVTALLLAAAPAAVRPAKAETGGKLVALTFDDGPSRDTARLLDGLRERKAYCTFFYVGQMLQRFPGIAEQAYRDGHELANHSYSHQIYTTLDDAGVLNQIRPVNEALHAITGEGTRILCRAPGGSTNEHIRQIAGTPFVFWSSTTFDYILLNAEKVKNGIVNDAFDGIIIILHDSHATSVDAALSAVDILQAQGYEFVTVSELFRRRGVPMENGVSYNSCKPTGIDLGPVQPPVFESTPAGGRLQITLTAQEGAAIYYSLSGPDINANSAMYTGPIEVDPPCSIWACAAYDMNGSRSPVVSQTFDYPPALPPLMDIKDGEMTLTPMTPGAEMHYSLNAGEEKVYSSPVKVSPGTVVKAWAQGSAYLPSAETAGTWSAMGHFFRDVYPEDWYYSTMDEAAEAEIMKGNGDSFYSPQKAITRAETASLLYRYSGEKLKKGTENTFTDLEAGSWAEEPVLWCASAGIMNPYNGTEIRPGDIITRQDLASMLTAYLKHRGVKDPKTEELTYADSEDIWDGCREAVKAVTAWGLMQGDDSGNFKPQEGATRAMAAAVILRLDKVDTKEAGHKDGGETLRGTVPVLGFVLLGTSDFPRRFPWADAADG